MKEELYNTRHLTALFGITKETVRVWAEDFAKFLSLHANPGRSKPRFFTPEDVSIFALIAELKSENLSIGDIQAALENGQRGSVPDLAPEEIERMLIVREGQGRSMDVELLQQSLSKLQAQYNETLAQYQIALKQVEEAKSIREENIQLKASLHYAEHRAEELAKRLEATEKRFDDLMTEQGRLREEVGKSYAKGVLDLLRKRGDLPEE